MPFTFDYLARLAQFQAGLVSKLAWRGEFPFSVQLPAKIKKQVAVEKRKWFG